MFSESVNKYDFTELLVYRLIVVAVYVYLHCTVNAIIDLVSIIM